MTLIGKAVPDRGSHATDARSGATQAREHLASSVPACPWVKRPRLFS